MGNGTDRKIEETEISLRDLILKAGYSFKYLWGKKWAIILMGIIGGTIGFFYASSKEKIYHATTTFVLESGEKSGGLGAYAGIASMVGIELGGDGGGIFQGDNIIQLYTSRTMLEKTLMSSASKDKTLMDLYLAINKKEHGWVDKPELLKIKFNSKESNVHSGITRIRDSLITDAVNDIRANNLIVIRPDKKLSIIKVTVKSINEDFAKNFNEELVKNVNEFYVKTKTGKTLQNVSILEKKTDSIRSTMNKAIYSTVAISDATPNINPTRQVQRAVPIQKAQFTAETNKAILSELVKNLEMSKIALLKETPLIQVVDYPIYPIPFTKISKMICVIVGGIIGGILIVFYLIISKYIKSLGL